MTDSPTRIHVEADPAGPRTTARMLESICQLLLENLTELRHIRATLAASGSVSSVQIEQGAKEVRICVKAYESSDVQSAGDAALAEFGRLFRLIEERQLRQWRDSVDAFGVGGGPS